jgi:hypothetical protein
VAGACSSDRPPPPGLDLTDDGDNVCARGRDADCPPLPVFYLAYLYIPPCLLHPVVPASASTSPARPPAATAFLPAIISSSSSLSIRPSVSSARPPAIIFAPPKL